jgi:predicted RNase H-like HicB family nuclease
MMNNIKYEITIYWSETDGVYIAEVPELAGCMADGETYNEALANAQIIVNQWIETAHLLNRAVPKPKNRFSFA